MFRFMVMLFQIFYLLTSEVSTPVPKNSQNEYCQPQKRIREMCCLCVKKNLIAWTELAYDRTNVITCYFSTVT